MSVNKAIIVGRLGDDPETREQSTPIVAFSVATDESYTDGQGNEVEETEWHDVVAFGRTAEVCDRYLSKGAQVYVEGAIQTSKYTDSDGIERYSTEIKALSVQFLETPDEDRRGQQMQRQDPSSSTPQAQGSTSGDGQPGGDDEFEPDDDLPF